MQRWSGQSKACDGMQQKTHKLANVKCLRNQESSSTPSFSCADMQLDMHISASLVKGWAAKWPHSHTAAEINQLINQTSFLTWPKRSSSCSSRLADCWSINYRITQAAKEPNPLLPAFNAVTLGLGAFSHQGPCRPWAPDSQDRQTC